MLNEPARDLQRVARTQFFCRDLRQKVSEILYIELLAGTAPVSKAKGAHNPHGHTLEAVYYRRRTGKPGLRNGELAGACFSEKTVAGLSWL